MLHHLSTIIENVPLADRTYRIRLFCPDIARPIRPGQFLMVRIPGISDPLLGRPFALYDTVLDESGKPAAIDVVYLVVGKMTGLLSQMKSDESIEVWGPLGNGFLDLGEQDHVVCVAGGIGQTPFLAYVRDLLGTRGYGNLPAKKKANRVSIYYGVRNRFLAAGVEDFQAAGAEVHLASDDGSIGHHGFVTQLLEMHTPEGHFIGCGPEPMLKALAQLTSRWGAICHVSLETPMACGFGVCFSCVTPLKQGDQWDYKRVCIEGPVFDAASLKWDQMH